MKISIIISAYKAKDFIYECLMSVLSQDYTDYEVLLGIDGCEETLKEVTPIKDNRLKVYYSGINAGKYIMCNSLIKMSKGQVFCCFDADDIMKSNFMSHNVGLFNNNTVEIIKTRCQNFKGEEMQRIYNPDGVFFCYRSLWSVLNGFDKYRCGMDTDFLIRSNKYELGADIVNSKEVTFLRRLHDKSLTNISKYGRGSEYRKDVQKVIDSRKITRLTKLHTTCLTLQN